MNYAEIKHFDIANGEGVRTTLFVSGCRRGCKNCFNEVAWNFAAGKPFARETEDAIIESMRPAYVDGLTILGGEPMEPENQEGLVAFVERAGKPFARETEDAIIESMRPAYVDGLTILGGEPMEPENQEGLVAFVERVRDEFPRESGKTIWCFTGDTWDVELVDGGRHHTEFTDRILRCVDVLVDGPWKIRKDSSPSSSACVMSFRARVARPYGASRGIPGMWSSWTVAAITLSSPIAS